jgi:hypothetical protein
MHEHNHLLRNIIIFGSFFAFLFICWVIIKPTVKEQISIFKAESQEEVEEVSTDTTGE